MKNTFCWIAWLLSLLSVLSSCKREQLENNSNNALIQFGAAISIADFTSFSNGDLLVYGTIQREDGQTFPWCARVSLSGKIIWHKQIDTTSAVIQSAIISSSDEIFLSTYGMQKDANNPSLKRLDGFIWKLDERGTLIKSNSTNKVFNLKTPLFPADLEIINNQVFLALYIENSSTRALTHFALFDNSLNLISDTSWNNSEGTYHGAAFMDKFYFMKAVNQNEKLTLNRVEILSNGEFAFSSNDYYFNGINENIVVANSTMPPQFDSKGNLVSWIQGFTNFPIISNINVTNGSTWFINSQSLVEGVLGVNGITYTDSLVLVDFAVLGLNNSDAKKKVRAMNLENGKLKPIEIFQSYGTEYFNLKYLGNNKVAALSESGSLNSNLHIWQIR